MTPACVSSFVALAAQDLTQPDSGQLSDDDLTNVMTAAVRLYAARAEAREEYPAPLRASDVTATDVAVTVSEMIRTVDMNLFDLSLWHGRPRNNREG